VFYFHSDSFAGNLAGPFAATSAGSSAGSLADTLGDTLADTEDEAPKSAPVDAAFSRMLKIRTVLVSGEITHEVADKAISQLLILDADNHDPIRVIISSQGGHVDSGYAIHDVLRYVESPIITVGAGWCASIAVPILLAAEKERRYSLPNTRFLLHQPSGGAGGQASDIRIAAEEIVKLRERLNALIAHETGKSAEQVTSDSDRNFWMNAEEAVAYGLVSKIITNSTEIA
jgi:ATP-dependent Clp protease protease subunit